MQSLNANLILQNVQDVPVITFLVKLQNAVFRQNHQLVFGYQNSFDLLRENIVLAIEGSEFTQNSCAFLNQLNFQH